MRKPFHYDPRHLRIKPANAVGAYDKLGRVEDVSLDEIQRLLVRLPDRAPDRDRRPAGHCANYFGPALDYRCE
jgi:hypothetical protein